ncbi:retrovirus-related pol polyprotein from transposon TNT 1-94 [Tanacetum coccineum]|uniref:Retrovirus-related pol polyprotein from transposon TNT 1-94 n=1 Tax=Tanacetum coccineum TaxID=301880 RepID=A0ABQ5FE28_9ASTR
MKKELSAHQETISITSQAKESQNQFHKTREDNELEKLIALENKIKVLDDIVYKTGQSVQTMNMFNRNCKTSFVKPKFVNKAQRANPRLYHIGCYNDNLALMIAPDSDETIRLTQESRSKLSDLIRTFDYEKLNNLYDLEYYYANHMNAILGVYTKLDEVTNLQCDYLEALEKCQSLENELSKRNTTSNFFEALQQHAINLELALQQSSRGIDMYSITLQDTSTPNPICLMAKATLSQAWLWHRRLSHLNFDTINLLSKNDIVIGLPKLKFVKDHLYSSCELGKAKRKCFHTKTTPSSKRLLQLLHMDLCGPMRVESINGKKYVLVIVDDYSRYTWTHFLKSKDETPEVLIDFLRLVQRGLYAQVRIV